MAVELGLSHGVGLTGSVALSGKGGHAVGRLGNVTHGEEGRLADDLHCRGNFDRSTVADREGVERGHELTVGLGSVRDDEVVG